MPQDPPQTAPQDKLQTAQFALTTALNQSSRFPAQLRASSAQPKDIETEIDIALSENGLGIHMFVMPLLPVRALRTENATLFLESVEIRVRIIENTALNRLKGFSAYDAMTAVFAALQGVNLLADDEPLFAAPLNLMARPVEYLDAKTEGKKNSAVLRIVDVLFDAAMQLH